MNTVKNEIEVIVDRYHQEHPLSGVLLITSNGEVLFEKAYGKASVQLDVSNTIETKFHIASVTKMFIAAAAVKFHEQGIMNLHVHPGMYIDKLHHLHPNMSIHHFISHTSGLSDIYALSNLRYVVSAINEEQSDFLEYLSRLDPLFEPGAGWRYSSTGFILTGYILEKVSGQSFGEMLQELFFDPLQMTSTGLDNPRKINENRAYGHTVVDGELRNADNDRLVDANAPGELYSTVHDLNRWCDAILGGTMLSEEAKQLIFTPYAAVDFAPELGYGYGWFLGDNFRLIGGGTPGFRSEIWQFPEQQTNVIMLWNNEKVDSHHLFRTIKDLLF